MSILDTEADHWPNERSGVDAGGALCLHIGRLWPGATHRLTLSNGLLSWQKQQSTTVDPADMREFIGSEDLTYRPDHGSSRGASSL